MMTYLILARKKKSETEEKSSRNQNELTTIKPESITKEDELMTIEAELVPNQSELTVISSNSATPKALTQIQPESPITYQSLVMTRKPSTKMQQELMKMNEQSSIMTSEQMQKEAGIAPRRPWKIYGKIAEALEKYENEKTGDPVQTITNLMTVVDLINVWIKKNIKDIQKGDPKKVKRKQVLENLQIQIGDELEKLVHLEGVASRLGSDLVGLLVQGPAYAKSPTPLFTYLMQKLISIYKIEELTGDIFKAELRNFLIADNDVIGATSLATQDIGGSGGVNIGFDVGKFILPCLKLNIDIGVNAKVADSSLIITECQSELNNPDGLQRYSLMNMKGRTMEGKLIAKVTAGIDVFSWEGQNIEILEQASLKTSAKIEASAELAGDVDCVFMQAIDAFPKHFNEVNEIDDDLFDIVQDKSKSDRLKLPRQTFTSLVSNGYSGGVGIGAEASLGAELNMGDQTYGGSATAGAKGSLNGSVKFTTYTYQNRLSNKTFKTQRTKMFLKQVYTLAEISGSIKAGQTPLYEDSKEKRYDLVNSLSYQSGFLFWDQKTQTLSQDGISGFAVGHSLISDELIKNVYGSDATKRSEYVKALAKQLGFAETDESIITNFLDKYNKDGLLEDILDQQTGPVFLEATYLAPTGISFRLDSDFKSNTPEAECFEQLGTENKTLQSLRFRTALEDDLNMSKSRFNFGFNAGLFKVGIDLGTIKQAGTLKLSDLVIEWYDSNGRPTDKQPAKYVPSSFLIL
ncbi:MAG: hypothetical protein QNJ42_04395 [Crocosphaera sp.]|nr:hypothetical protein [Crocosphaera sp.]